MNIFLQAPTILCTYLVIAFALAAPAHAQASAGNRKCPTGIYRGTVEFILINKDLEPITSTVANMLFFYSDEPKKLPQASNALHLKNVMLCSDGDMAVNTVTKHLGTYTFQSKECKISLNGTGQIKDKELVEQGNARLTCQDGSVIQGSYSIRATHLAGSHGKVPANPETNIGASSGNS
ncbi:MAG: hypothetical protein D3919_16105 [Candidatus Electrothrix sp. AW5]|nr:hypothetical protein [Candidatus Electrothrix gigas]